MLTGRSSPKPHDSYMLHRGASFQRIFTPTCIQTRQPRARPFISSQPTIHSAAIWGIIWNTTIPRIQSTSDASDAISNAKLRIRSRRLQFSTNIHEGQENAKGGQLVNFRTGNYRRRQTVWIRRKTNPGGENTVECIYRKIPVPSIR